ncbi:phosphoribosyltransferase family protein [Kitasatospora sp. MBT63]|uniref:phosphoribosyltransferase family protein n=1 Tax=Kitasatospora sp. MBT63 TaxID=1444768 RepID=UPI00068F5F08|nr:phosphoribosyltransferase family protein [Kitasatospora sp. MBT63]
MELARAVDRRLDRARPRPAVYALSRGGVPVAHQVARRLGAPLDVLMPSAGTRAWRDGSAGALQRADPPLYTLTASGGTGSGPGAAGRSGAGRLRQVPAVVPRVTGRTVVVVDDGLTEGEAVRTVIRRLRLSRPAAIVLAAPVCSPRAVALLWALVDQLVCLDRPWYFRAVSDWYRDFRAPLDSELTQLLAEGGRPDDGLMDVSGAPPVAHRRPRRNIGEPAGRGQEGA